MRVRLAMLVLVSHDLGEVLAREPGVGVRRSAGLGSESRVSLKPAFIGYGATWKILRMR